MIAIIARLLGVIPVAHLSVWPPTRLCAAFGGLHLLLPMLEGILSSSKPRHQPFHVLRMLSIAMPCCTVKPSCHARLAMCACHGVMGQDSNLQVSANARYSALVAPSQPRPKWLMTRLTR